MADFYLLGNSAPTQMLGCVIQTETKTIVIDGGTPQDGEQLSSLLRDRASSHVNAWFFTHPHHDHIGAFCSIRKQEPRITVNGIYCHFPPFSALQLCKPRSPQEPLLWADIEEWKDTYAFHNVLAGECFTFDDVTVQVLRVFNPAIQNNFINNSSAVFRIASQRQSILILGDLGEEGGRDLMTVCPRELLQTDYTQMAHHGQRGVSQEFYEYIRPKRCLWPTPEWLWENDAGGGFDTGPWQTVRTREWMEKLGVTAHFAEKDGTQTFTF